MIDDTKFDEILKNSKVKSATPTNAGWFSQLDRNKPIPPKERNVAQKAAGFLLDPIVKLANEGGQLAGKGIVRGIEQFQSPEQRAITEANLQRVLNTPSQVPGLGTETKALNNVTARDVAGQAIEAAAMFAPGSGKAATTIGGKFLSSTGVKLTPAAIKAAELAGKTIVGAGQGYGFDVAQGLQNEDKTLKESLKPGISTVISTVLPGIGEAVKYSAKNLPTWFAKGILPKLDENKIGIDETLNKLNYGSVTKNLNKSADRVSTMGSNIDKILKKPENEAIKIGKEIIDDTLTNFPDSNYNADHIIKEVKALVPSKGKLIDKIIIGTATPFEINELKKEIYKKTSKVFDNIGIPPERKEIGASFATTIADKLKSTISETKPIWEELTKEINLRNALIGASKKAQNNAKLGLFDVVGYFSAGLPGMAGERFVRSPSVQLSAAKALNKLSKNKVIPNVAEGVKRVTQKALSSINN